MRGDRQVRRRGHVADSDRIRDPADARDVRWQNVERLAPDGVMKRRGAVEALAACACGGNVPPKSLETGKVRGFKGLFDPIEIVRLESLNPSDRLIDRPR